MTEQQKPKVYDAFMFFNELDLLEIRLNILDPYVDYFVLCESKETFSGKPKPLYYLENQARFAKWNHKIINMEVEAQQFPNSFERAAYQKDSIRFALKDCQPDDVIYYGDLDEIWTPQTEEGKLRQLNYSYYLNNRSSEEWQGTNVIKYKNLYNLNELRADHGVILDNGGWHFTNMGGVEQVLKKLDAYDHQEFNTPEVRQEIAKKIENGEDYVGRRRDWQGKPFEMWIDETQLPEYVIMNKEKWRHLWK